MMYFPTKAAIPGIEPYILMLISYSYLKLNGKIQKDGTYFGDSPFS